MCNYVTHNNIIINMCYYNFMTKVKNLYITL